MDCMFHYVIAVISGWTVPLNSSLVLSTTSFSRALSDCIKDTYSRRSKTSSALLVTRYTQKAKHHNSIRILCENTGSAYCCILTLTAANTMSNVTVISEMGIYSSVRLKLLKAREETRVGGRTTEHKIIKPLIHTDTMIFMSSPSGAFTGDMQ